MNALDFFFENWLYDYGEILLTLILISIMVK